MESTAQYWRPVWEALERDWQPRKRHARRRPARRCAASGAGAVQRGPARPEAGFSGCRTVGETLGRPGADPELRAGRDAAAVADGRAAQISIDLQSGAAAEPPRVPARGDAHQALESGRRSARAQCASHAARRREWRNGPGRRGRPGQSRGCTPRRTNCATRSARAPICIRCTDGCSP